MGSLAVSSLGLFGAVWALFCLLAGLFVTDRLVSAIEPPVDAAGSTHPEP